MVHMPRRTYVHLQIFRFVGGAQLLRYVSSKKKMKKNMAKLKYHIKSITPVLQDLFSQYHWFSTCSLLVEVKLSGISVSTAIMLNNHINPYIESTTVLSDSVEGSDVCIIMYEGTGRDSNIP